MSRRARHSEAHQEPRTVSLTPALASVLSAPGLDPEALLMAAEEPEEPEENDGFARCHELRPLPAIDELAIRWWMLGLSQLEVARWLGVAQQRVHQRIRRGLAKMRA